MEARCHYCGLNKEMNSHNLSFVSGNAYYYRCDDCKITDFKKSILKALQCCNQIIDVEKLTDLLQKVIK